MNTYVRIITAFFSERRSLMNTIIKRSFHSLAVSSLALAIMCLGISQPEAAEVKVPTITAETPMDSVTAIHDFFNSAEGKVRFQLASSETQYGWQHASRF